MSRIWLSTAVALALVALPRAAPAQDHPAPSPGAQCPAGQVCPGHEGHEAMARHEAMIEQHAAAAARLQELQDRMHQATGDARVDAIAALLDEMLAQHRAMHEMMMEEHAGEMGHDGMKAGMEDDDR